MVQDFIRWTDALIHFFFSEEAEEEVFLYVDQNILDQIGVENGLGCYKNFLDTILIPTEKRIKFFDELDGLRNGHLSLGRTCDDNKKINSQSILNFAVVLSNKFKNKLYYLPYIVLAMYYASEAMKQNRNDIGAYIKEKFSINNYNHIEYLFSKLHACHPKFKNKLKTQQKIVGLIKYQLLLSPSEINEIEKALFKISYEDDYNFTYTDKIQKIKDYVNDHVKTILSESLSNSDFQYRINSIFENFDLELYREAHPNNETGRFREDFALYLDFSKDRGFKLLSSYRPINGEEITQDSSSFAFTPSIDSIDCYNNKFVKYNDLESVYLREFKLDTDHLEIKPIPLGDVAFFYKYCNGGYLQSRSSYNRRVYIFVKKSRNNTHINKWEQWAQINANNCRRIDDKEPVEDLTQGRWALYLADGILEPYYTTDNGLKLKNTVKSIVKRGGILCRDTKNVYLINALPYFEFPDEIYEQGLSLVVKRDDIELDKESDYKYYVQGNRLILDMTKDIDYEESRRIEVNIQYKDPNTNEELKTSDNTDGNPVFYVRGQEITYNQNNLYCFNKWGDIVNNEKRYIQGNLFSGIDKCALGRGYHEIDSSDISNNLRESFYFINLLSSCLYMEDNSQITRERLKKCIRYATTRLNVNMTEDSFVTKVISLLVNCGYITADYSTSHYQAIPAAFVKIPRSFVTGDLRQIWMLTGAYSRRFLSDLFSFCRENNIKIKLRYSHRLNQSIESFKLLPPIILIHENFNPEQFSQHYNIHHFDIINDTDQALNFLSLIPSITEYQNTLTRISRNRVDMNFVKPDSRQFPRIREDNPYSYNNHVYIEESCNGDFLRPTVSEKWYYLYCTYKKNNPFIIHGTQHIYLPVFLHLPSLIQRSLFVMNVGIPSYRKVFICGYPTKKMYTEMKAYKVNDNRLNLFFEKITGSRYGERNLFVRDKVVSSNNYNFNNWEYQMELWRKCEDEELNINIPVRLLVLWFYDRNYNSKKIEAVTTSFNKTYVMRDNRLLEVRSDKTGNEIMSFIIQSHRWQYNQIPFSDNPTELIMPNREQYNIEVITIL